MGYEPNQTRRKIILGTSAALVSSPLGPFGELVDVFQKGDRYRDPFVSPFNRELSLHIKAKEHFKNYYGDKAGKLADMAFDCLNKYGKKDHPHDPLIFLGQMGAESNFGDTRTFVSKVGAVGSTQVMPYIADKPPFNLKVYHPDYYKETKKERDENRENLMNLEGRALVAIHNITSEETFKKLYSEFDEYRNEFGSIDLKSMLPKEKEKYDRLMEDAEDQFFKKMGREVSDMVFRYLFSSEQRKDFDEKVDERYDRYVDEIGELIFVNYRKGTISRMRNDKLRRLKPAPKLKPEKEYADIEQRPIDELIVPPSYREMQRLMREFDGNPITAVAAYNAGQSNIREGGKLPPPFRETWNYLGRVFWLYQQFCKDLGVEATF